jgi:hypothetical protein
MNLEGVEADPIEAALFARETGGRLQKCMSPFDAARKNIAVPAILIAHKVPKGSFEISFIDTPNGKKRAA